MAEKKPSHPGSATSALTHSPFARLADDSRLADLVKSSEQASPSQARAPKAPPPCKVRLQHESRGRSGKVVTRISGLPIENLGAIASRLRKGLGCGATIEEGDVILQGSLAERASEWLERAGDPRSIRQEPTPVEKSAPPQGTADWAAPGAANLGSPNSLLGTNRADVRPGQRVAIVLKADQPSGKTTDGIVRDLLTNSPTHPRGIKVRIESGDVGRVKTIYSQG